MMRMTVPLSALLVSAFLALPPTDAAAEDAGLPAPEVTFVISTGFWQEPQDDAQAVPIQRGYYKLIALRQPDGTAHIHLQQIASTPEGPRVLTSAELEEFSDLRAYVTDIRPDSSSGVSSQPGLFATVYLKTDPAAPETESWTVLIDDLGDVRVERATN